MSKYLLLKLAEEAGEVVVAAIKHRLHRSPSTLTNLEKEVGDVLAIVQLLCETDYIAGGRIKKYAERREVRERKRMRGH